MMLKLSRWIFGLFLIAVVVLPVAAVADLAQAGRVSEGLPRVGERQHPCPQPPHKLILLRHAPRANDSEDSPLSKRGWEEAGRLVTLLGDEPISTIYVSTKRRTQQTAMPLAEYLEVRPVVVADTPEGTAQLLGRICQSRRTDTLVYVGHTYTLDKIFDAFGFEAPSGGSEPVHEIGFGPAGPKLRQIR